MKARLTIHAPMAKHNTWRVGGRAKRLFRPQSLDDLVRFMRALPPQEPVIYLGLGSNMLWSDHDFPGTVILLAGCLQTMSVPDESGLLSVDGGVTCAKLAKIGVRMGCIDSGFWAGIPGTLGGALRMNAGAYGHETWSFVEAVHVMNRSGDLAWLPPSDFDVGYRSVGMAEPYCFVGARLRLPPTQGDVVQARQAMKAWLAKRNASQPIGLPSCGSVFTNPPGGYAAAMIEQSGLKGYALGGAQVSPKHANFIINTGSATSQDIEDLMRYVQRRVLIDHGVALHPEVQTTVMSVV